jgi:hypothetical protein
MRKELQIHLKLFGRFWNFDFHFSGFFSLRRWSANEDLQQKKRSISSLIPLEASFKLS